MEPPNYVGDDFSRVTQIYRVTQFNIACCYSSLGQVCSIASAASHASSSFAWLAAPGSWPLLRSSACCDYVHCNACLQRHELIR